MVEWGRSGECVMVEWGVCNGGEWSGECVMVEWGVCNGGVGSV